MTDVLRALVTSDARAKVLTSLFGERGRPFYQSELARATGVPLAAVQRELKRLVDAGLVRRETLAGRRVYQAETAASVYEEIASLIRKLRGPATIVRDALAARSHVEVAFVFGSFADGSAGATSDVDLLVLTPDSSRAIRTVLGRAERGLNRTVNEHVMTSHEWRQRIRKKDPFIMNIRGAPKTWVIGDDEALVRLEARPRQ